MSKSKLLFVIAICLFIAAPPAFSAGAPKIGLIDFQKILKQSQRGKAIQADLAKQHQQMQADLDRKSKEIEELKKRLDREALVMSKAMADEKKREMRIKINDIKVLKEKYSREILGIEKRLVRRMQKEIVKLVGQLGKKEGYQLILDKTAGGVVYAPDTIDITPQVIKVYDTSTAKKK